MTETDTGTEMYEFEKKPVTVAARRLDERLEIETMEGTLVAEAGDWLIEGVEGEHYPCADSVFRETYRASTRAAASEFAREIIDVEVDSE